MDDRKAEENMAIIFVIGSKPDAILPELEADFIYIANGALRRELARMR